MPVGVDYRSTVAAAVLGSSRSPAVPSRVWLGWHSAAGVELSTDRVAVANTDAVWGKVTGGVQNISDIDAGVAGAWIVGGVGLYTAQTGGTLMLSASLPSLLTTSAGDLLTIPAGELTFTVA